MKTKFLCMEESKSQIQRRKDRNYKQTQHFGHFDWFWDFLWVPAWGTYTPPTSHSARPHTITTLFNSTSTMDNDIIWLVRFNVQCLHYMAINTLSCDTFCHKFWISIAEVIVSWEPNRVMIRKAWGSAVSVHCFCARCIVDDFLHSINLLSIVCPNMLDIAHLTHFVMFKALSNDTYYIWLKLN